MFEQFSQQEQMTMNVGSVCSQSAWCDNACDLGASPIIYIIEKGMFQFSHHEFFPKLCFP